MDNPKVSIDRDNYSVVKLIQYELGVSEQEALTKLINYGFPNLITNGLSDHDLKVRQFKKGLEKELKKAEIISLSKRIRDVWSLPEFKKGKIVEL